MSDLADKENNSTHANIFDALAQLEPDTKSESSYSRSNTQPFEELATDGTSRPNFQKPGVITSKDWKQSDLQQELNIKLTPSAEQHAQEYESHFPTLGQSQDTLKPETDFNPEILSPVNIVASQSHVESGTESIPAAEPVQQEWVNELKDPNFIEVKAHKPSGAKKAEQEEALEPEEPAEQVEPVEPVVVQPQSTELLKPSSTEKAAAKPVIIQAPTIAPAKNWEELEEPKVEETPIEESEIAPKENNPAKSNIFEALAQLEPKISEDDEASISRSNPIPSEKAPAPKPVETKFVKPRVGIMVTPAVEEQAHEYESHFPTLGQESVALQPETEFKPEILSPVNIVAESILSGDFIEVKPNRRPPSKNISEEAEEIIDSEQPAITRTEPIELDRSTPIEKPVAKPAIYEAPTIAPAKGWTELERETGIREVKVKVTPELAKKSHKYENLFPALGEEPKDSGVEAKFKPEILNPINIVVSEAHGETPKVAINPEALNVKRVKPKVKGAINDDLAPIEEHIEIQDDDVKPYAKGRSSLEYLHEDNVMNQSTELTLSVNRIDLIREELRETEARALSRDPIFQDVERSLLVVRDLEKGNQYGEAIKLLKKNMEILDARFMKKDDFDTREMNKLLFEINLQLAGCYHHINEIRYAIDHARAALTFNSQSPKAIYLLGTSLIRAHNIEEGYSILKQIRRIPLQAGDAYEELVEHELRMYERRAQEVIKDIEEPNKKENSEISALGGLGLFVGSALTSGIVSWFISKNSLGLSEKRSWLYSIGAGTVMGGLSLALMAHSSRKQTV